MIEHNILQYRKKLRTVLLLAAFLLLVTNLFVTVPELAVYTYFKLSLGEFRRVEMRLDSCRVVIYNRNRSNTRYLLLTLRDSCEHEYVVHSRHYLNELAGGGDAFRVNNKKIAVYVSNQGYDPGRILINGHNMTIVEAAWLEKEVPREIILFIVLLVVSGGLFIYVKARLGPIAIHGDAPNSGPGDVAEER
jgi:hypothetical protein